MLKKQGVDPKSFLQQLKIKQERGKAIDKIFDKDYDKAHELVQEIIGGNKCILR